MMSLGLRYKKGKKVDGHSKIQLKRWLQCRGLLVGGNKKQLVERILACQSNGGAAIVNYIDRGTWYRAKSTSNSNNRVPTNLFPIKVPQFPILSSKKFPSRNISPQFCYGVIYKHIIETAVLVPNNIESNTDDESKEDVNPVFNTSKPIRKGRCFFLSGRVQNLQNNLTKDGYFCLKSEVRASFKDKIYKVLIMLDRSNNCTVLDS
jgi:hypothetical protein